MEGATNMIATALSNVSTILTSAIEMVTGNELAMVFIGIGLASAGIGLFRKIRHA